MSLPLPPMDDSAPSSSKTLTPQRKHRKLLKDGSGTAVWPEAIESIFVQGLREYWDSPWATYSRGRSRWRNQFLVDYLQNLGIVRTKKQVASHIQVLRNMWKGEPEYHLVAGGEELFQDPVKVEEHPTLLTLADEDDNSDLSNSPPDFFADFPPSPGETFPGLTYSPSSPLSSVPDLDSPPNAFSTLSTPYPYGVHQKAYPAAFAPPPVAPVRYPNRTTSLTLLADGMTAFSVNIDKLAPAAPLPARTPPLVLRLRLTIPPVDDTRAPANLHGFFASAKVFTRVYDGAGQCISNEEGALQPSSVELGTCRRLAPRLGSHPGTLIVVDGSTLLLVVYELDRRTTLPAADLVSFQKYTSAGDAKPPPSPVYASYAPATTHYSYAPAPSAYSPPASAPSYSPTSSAPAYSPPSHAYYAPSPYAQQSQPYGHPPPTSSYTPSLSSALTPVPLRS
ncbi:hypothetical protein DFH09DRAFT_1356976 [Mycena vulgaris]|nr:hypothetical protein DFH09DRAFT_1356976 [Mycena vulgaris]